MRNCAAAIRRRLSFAAILSEIESHDACLIARSFEHLRVAQRADRIMVTSAPVLLHAPARKLVILRAVFALSGPVDQLDEVVHFAIGIVTEKLAFRTIPQFLRNPL
jgi:hypothetical protein